MNTEFASIEEAVEEIKKGRIIIVTDDEDRENEGDFIMAAEKVRHEDVNFILRYGRGLLCQGVTKEQAEKLGLPPMVEQNTSSHATAFTVSVDAAQGTTTGISASDRAETIRVLGDDNSHAGDLLRPGHVFPLIAAEGGVLQRRGHTEAAVDLARLAGLSSSGILCEILSENGETAKLSELRKIAERFDMKIISIADLVEYRKTLEPPTVRRVTETVLPTEYGSFQLKLYNTGSFPGREDFALVSGSLDEQAPLVRVHSECMTGEVLGSRRCDCGYQLQFAMKKVSQHGGVVVYLRQEGRGIGFANKLKAYALQDSGIDTVDANLQLGFPADCRDYRAAAQILKDLGITRIRLMTNNPEKVRSLEAAGIRVERRVPIESHPHEHNTGYLSVKKEKCGHLLEMV
ncbi:MAG: 3,4-dihydroxy-2-butanone-4-phosphate synthase [Spirochaetia bacterium]